MLFLEQRQQLPEGLLQDVACVRPPVVHPRCYMGASAGSLCGVAACVMGQEHPITWAEIAGGADAPGKRGGMVLAGTGAVKGVIGTRTVVTGDVKDVTVAVTSVTVHVKGVTGCVTTVTDTVKYVTGDVKAVTGSV